MRPKKRILLIDSDETWRSIRSFMLTTQGFAVCAAASTEEAHQAMEDFKPDLAIGCWPFIGADLGKLLDAFHEDHPEVRTMVLAEKFVATPDSLHADIVLLKGACSAAELVERIKCICARKRGPVPQKKAPESERGVLRVGGVFPRLIVVDGVIQRRTA